MWLPLTRPPLGTWPATQACALIGNGTGDPLVPRPVLNPLSHTSQEKFSYFTIKVTYSQVPGIRMWFFTFVFVLFCVCRGVGVANIQPTTALSEKSIF